MTVIKQIQTDPKFIEFPRRHCFQDARFHGRKHKKTLVPMLLRLKETNFRRGRGGCWGAGSEANLLEASFLLGQRQLRRPVRGCREPGRSLNRKSPAWVSRLRLRTGGTDGVQALGSENRGGAQGPRRCRRQARSSAARRLLHQVKHI